MGTAAHNLVTITALEVKSSIGRLLEQNGKEGQQVFLNPSRVAS